MDQAFRKVFEDSLQRQIRQNEEARRAMEGFLDNLRARTEQLINQGVPVASMPVTIPQDPLIKSEDLQQLHRSNEQPALNEVSTAWVKTVIQAASLDIGFLQETGAKATQIVMDTLQGASPPVAPTSDESKQ